MAWIKPEYTKSQVRRAGKALISCDLGSEEYQNALDITNNWRAAHALPLNTFKILLLKKAQSIETDAIVVQRLKRMKSIEKKLRNSKLKGSETDLSRMQDIGGCRVIFHQLSSVYSLINTLDSLNPNRFTHVRLEPVDYIKNPKLSGYRGVHLIYKFNSSRRDEYNGMRIEIQIRTYLQHLWATTVETTEAITKTSLKASIGPYEWLRFFSLMSSIFCIVEDCPTVPETPSDFADILNEIRSLDYKFHIYDQLKAYHTFVSSIENSNVDRADYYLVITDYENSVISITLYGEDELQIATDRYNELEQKQEAGSNVVLIATSSMEALKKAYPNYFNNIQGFVTLLSTLLARDVDGEDYKLEIIRRYEQLKLEL